MSEPTWDEDRRREASPSYQQNLPAQWQGQPSPPYGEPPAPWGTPPEYRTGVAMQGYGQPGYSPQGMGMRLVTPGGRLGASLLDGLLAVVTFGIGWLIWSLVTWGSGQTPAKQLLHQVVADANTGQQFTWGRMFLREFVVRGIVFAVVNVITLGIFGLVDALMVFREDHRTLHDMASGSVVRYL